MKSGNFHALKAEKNGYEYTLYLPIGAQLEDAKDVALGFASSLISAWEKNKEAIAEGQKEAEDKKSDESVEEAVQETSGVE